MQEYSVGAKVIPCSFIYERLPAKCILKPLKGTTSEVEPEDVHKTCAYHPDRKGHTIEECEELKATIRNLIKIEKIPYMWGDNTLLTYDQPEPIYRSQCILCSTVTSSRILRERGWISILAEHPYFIRSKAPKDSFPSQNSQNGKVVMGDNNEEIGLTDVVVAQPVIADQNELIMQLMQQITEMRVEMQRRQDSPNPVYAFNAPADERLPLHFPSSNAE
uniref:Integrase core domain containing protein n=1 Tax=Solanum tuberosum TaxID=4113 RepID=M1DI32_SOLTU